MGGIHVWQLYDIVSQPAKLDGGLVVFIIVFLGDLAEWVKVVN